MAIYDGTQAAQEHLLAVAKHCAHAVLKAPQMTQRLRLKTEIVTGEDLLPVIEVYGEMAKASWVMRYDYLVHKTAYEQGNPPVFLLIGADLTVSEMAWNCGACGFDTCVEFNRFSKQNRGMGGFTQGPSCNWKVIDYATACGWACAAAWQYNVENRIQFTAGAVFTLLGYMEDCSVLVGLPLGPCHDLWYYNRPSFTKEFEYDVWKDFMVKTVPNTFMGFPMSGIPPFKISDTFWKEPLKTITIGEQPELMPQIQEATQKFMEFVEKKRKEVQAKRNKELSQK